MRMCSACRTEQKDHELFWIVPNVVKSICSTCRSLGYIFDAEGRVVRGRRLEVAARQGKNKNADTQQSQS